MADNKQYRTLVVFVACPSGISTLTVMTSTWLNRFTGSVGLVMSAEKLNSDGDNIEPCGRPV